MNSQSPEQSEAVRRWTLELRSLEELCAKFVQRDDVAVRQVEVPLPSLNQFLHQQVGTKFRWGGREDWSDGEWAAFVKNPEVETWVIYVQGTPAGYFETEHFDDGAARIHCFGLLRPFFGQGLGAHLLSFAAERAFARGAKHIWLRTCSKDHAHALENYLARGFVIVHEELLI